MAEPPDPMPCALAAILLPALRAHGCHIQKGLFPGTYWVHARTCVFGPFLRAGCAGASWMRGGSLGTSMRAGRRCLTTRAGSVHCRVLPCSDTDACRHCAGERVGSWATRCLPAVRGRACVVAWAGGASGGSFGVFAPVAVWAIAWLLRWGPVLCGKATNGACYQGSQEFIASAVAYRPGSLADAQGQAVACPPRTLLCVPG